MKNLRRFPRRPVNFEVNVTFSNHESTTLKAKDVSDGGMYIASQDVEHPYIGELLHVELVKQPRLTETLPHEDAVVVHKGLTGFGLSFVEMDDEL